MFRKLHFSKSVSSAIYSGSWQMITNSPTRTQYLNLIRPNFWYKYLSYFLYHMTLNLERSLLCPQKSFSDFSEIWHVDRGRWLMHGLLDNLRIANSRTGHLADWSTHGLDNSRIPTMWTYRIISLTYVLSTHVKTLINGLTTIFNCIFLWNTSVLHTVWQWHVLCPHNHLLKLQLLPATSSSCPVHELTSPWVL